MHVAAKDLPGRAHAKAFLVSDRHFGIRWFISDIMPWTFSLKLHFLLKVKQLQNPHFSGFNLSLKSFEKCFNLLDFVKLGGFQIWWTRSVTRSVTEALGIYQMDTTDINIHDFQSPLTAWKKKKKRYHEEKKKEKQHEDSHHERNTLWNKEDLYRKLLKKMTCDLPWEWRQAVRWVE